MKVAYLLGISVAVLLSNVSAQAGADCNNDSSGPTEYSAKVAWRAKCHNERRDRIAERAASKQVAETLAHILKNFAKGNRAPAGDYSNDQSPFVFGSENPLYRNLFDQKEIVPVIRPEEMDRKLARDSAMSEQERVFGKAILTDKEIQLILAKDAE